LLARPVLGALENFRQFSHGERLHLEEICGG
jgi:hypothetical protein